MRIKKIKNTAKLIVCWIVLLQMVNLCIDPPHVINFSANHAYQQEDPSIDEIESIYELISETLFGQAIPGNADNDIDSDSVPLDLYFYTTPNTVVFDFPTGHTTLRKYNFPAFAASPNIPPPKQC